MCVIWLRTNLYTLSCTNMFTFSNLKSNLLEGNVVPDDFYKNIFHSYWVYDFSRKGKAKKAAFYYFVERILSAVNAQITKFEKQKSNVKISEMFSVSDEVFAVMIIEYYKKEMEITDHWKGLKEVEKWSTLSSWIYSSRIKGVHNNSWSEEGMKILYDWCCKIQELRKDKKLKMFLKKKFWHIIVVSRMSLVIVYQKILRNKHCYTKNLLKMGGRI